MKRNEFLNYVRLVVVMVLLFSITLYSTDLRTYEIDDDAFDKYKTGNDNYSSWMIPENIPRCDLYEYKHVNPIYNKQLEERGGRIYFSFLMSKYLRRSPSSRSFSSRAFALFPSNFSGYTKKRPVVSLPIL